MAPLVLAAIKIAAGFVPELIGKMAGGDAQNVAAKVVDIAQAVTGRPDPESAMAVLNADPTKVLEFKQAVLENETAIEQAYLADVQSARNMQMAALGQDDLFSKRFVYLFAAAWSVFSMIYFAAVTFAEVPSEGQRIADTILGVLIGQVLGGMFSYFYGSTKGSAEKTRLLAASTPK